MARSLWKLYFRSNFLIKKCYISKFTKTRIKEIYYRGSTITDFFYKRNVLIHKGNLFSKVLINKYQIGYKLGEFSFTRKPFNFTKKKKKKIFALKDKFLKLEF